MLDARLRMNETAQSQRGLVTREDLVAVGISRGQLRQLLSERALVSLGPRTYQVGGMPADDRHLLLAACLDGGGIASHRSAAWLHGMGRFRVGEPPEILVRRGGKSVQTPLALVHSTTWLPTDDVTSVDGIPCTSVARTLLALAGLVPEVTFDHVRGTVDDAIRLGTAREKWLWWRLEKLRCRGRSGVANFEAILQARAAGAVTESWLEREFLRLLADAALEVPVCQARIEAAGAFVARVDFLYPEGVIIEVTGAVAHASAAQRASDAVRRNRLARSGYLVLEFTYEQVVGDPGGVVAEVIAARASRKIHRAS